MNGRERKVKESKAGEPKTSVLSVLDENATLALILDESDRYRINISPCRPRIHFIPVV
jgi:hypothetical protein